MLEETLSVSTVTRPIFLTQLCTLTWNKNIQKVQMVSLETHQPAEEAEVDQERILTKD